MKSTGVLAQFCRGLAAGFLGLWLAQQSAACVGQEPKSAGETEEKAATTTTVCPIYEIMDFGTYVSYYAVIYDLCTEAVTYDGPRQELADCNTGERCVDFAFVGRKAGPRRHATHRDLERDGIDPPTEATPGEIAEVVHDDPTSQVEYIEFPKSGSGGGGGQMVRAKVWFLKAEPDHGDTIFAGVGHEVGSGVADRTFADGEVVVAEPSAGKEKRVSVLVLTDRAKQIWRPYNILLLK